MDVQHYLADISLKTMSRVHRAIVQLSGGKILGSAFGGCLSIDLGPERIGRAVVFRAANRVDAEYIRRRCFDV